jgi:hypothetical protein
MAGTDHAIALRPSAGSFATMLFSSATVRRPASNGRSSGFGCTVSNYSARATREAGLMLRAV